MTVLDARTKLQNLAEALARDIDSLTDEEVLHEAEEDGIDADHIKALFIGYAMEVAEGRRKS